MIVKYTLNCHMIFLWNSLFEIVFQVIMKTNNHFIILELYLKVTLQKQLIVSKLYGTNFHVFLSRFNIDQPIYINLIRDPITRYASHYYCCYANRRRPGPLQNTVTFILYKNQKLIDVDSFPCIC